MYSIGLMLRNTFCTVLLTLVVAFFSHVNSLAIRNYDTNSYPFSRLPPTTSYSVYPSSTSSYSQYSNYPLSPTTTVSPAMDRSPLYANSFANPTSLTSFFSPDRYSHLNSLNLLSPNLGGIKLFPPSLTNHFHQKFPTTNYPVTTLVPPPTTTHHGSTTPSSHLPTSASFESMDSSPVIVRPKKPTRRPLATSSLYETSSSSVHTIPTHHPSSPSAFIPSYHLDATKPDSPTSSDPDSPPGSLGLLYVCKYLSFTTN